MEILFSDRKLEKVCKSRSLLIQSYGPICAKLIQSRLDDLRGANNLEFVRHLSQMRCHELTGDRKGTLAVDVKHPFRLIFEPANEPIPKKMTAV